jgi:ring-1,2-phenylacetyl-CoA epoxidase subunit PaaD
VSWAAIWSSIAGVPDPEIPVLSVADLGVVRDVQWDIADPEVLVLHVTPTYSGCPATELIMDALADAVRSVGVRRSRIERVLSPAWSTAWMTPAAQRKLRDYGIAPPGAARATRSTVPVGALRPHRERSAVPCPRCGSLSTELVSQFGSTPCKAHFRCRECLEPFDFFKPL